MVKNPAEQVQHSVWKFSGSEEKDDDDEHPCRPVSPSLSGVKTRLFLVLLLLLVLIFCAWSDLIRSRSGSRFAQSDSEKLAPFALSGSHLALEEEAEDDHAKAGNHFDEKRLNPKVEAFEDNVAIGFGLEADEIHVLCALLSLRLL